MQFRGFHTFLLANWREGGKWSAILKWNGVEIFWSGLIQRLGKGKWDYKLSLLPNMCMAIVTNFTNKRFGTSWFCHYCQNVTHGVVTIGGHICSTFLMCVRAPLPSRIQSPESSPALRCHWLTPFAPPPSRHETDVDPTKRGQALVGRTRM